MFIIQMRRKLNINTLLLIIFLVGVGFYFIRSPNAMANPTRGYFTKVGAGIDSVKEDLPIVNIPFTA